MNQRFVALIAFLIASMTVTAWANDSVARVAAGGVTFLKSPDIKMVEEVLDVSKKSIQVKYRFRNESTEDIHTTVAFPMPTYRWQPEEFNNGPIRGFSVTVDGATVPTQRIRKAILKQRDITKKLRAIGLTDIQMFEDGGGDCSPDQSEMQVGCGLTKEQRKKIAQLLGEKDYFPSWGVEETYLWEQTFPAGKEIEVRHEYSSFSGGRYAYPYWQGKRQDNVELPVARSNAEACVDGSTTRAVERKVQALVSNGAKSIRIFHTDVEYILGTGRNWKGPIDQFTLRIHKSSPDEIVSLCMTGKPKKINDTIIEFTQSQYVPQDWLVVYFYVVKSE